MANLVISNNGYDPISVTQGDDERSILPASAMGLPMGEWVVSAAGNMRVVNNGNEGSPAVAADEENGIEAKDAIERTPDIKITSNTIYAVLKPNEAKDFEAGTYLVEVV